MRPHPHRQAGDGKRGEHHADVAVERLGRKYRDDLRDDAERGQDHHVDFGVAEEPEQVLVQNHVAAVLRIEEVRAVMSLEQQLEHRNGKRGKRHENEQRRRENLPCEDRHAPHRHSGRAIENNRRCEIHRDHDRRNTVEEDADDPQILPAAGAGDLRRKGCVRGPAGGGSAAFREHAAKDRKAADHEEIDAEGVQPRKCHVRRADLQGHQIVSQAESDRRDDQENHRRAVQGEYLVVRMRRDDILMRLGQLQPDHEREQARDDEEESAGHDVHDADRLVVRGRQPMRHTGDCPPLASQRS